MEDKTHSVVKVRASMYKNYPYTQIKSNDLDELKIPWCLLDGVESCLKNHKIFILNLDTKEPPGTGQGTHWTTVATNRKTGSLFYYDPLGHRNDGNYPATGGDDYERETGFPKMLVDAAKKMGFTNFHTNPNNNQFVESWMCGYYAIHMYLHLLNAASRDVMDLQHFNGALATLTPRPSTENIRLALETYKRLKAHPQILVNTKRGRDQFPFEQLSYTTGNGNPSSLWENSTNLI